MPGARPYRRRIRLAMTRMAELGEAVFGDRRGVALFLVVLLFHAFTWRAGVFITDNYTLANGLVAVSQGQIEVVRILYGPESGATPGMHYVDGELYARNYGQLVLALPFLWLLDGVAAVADLRVAIAGAWSLCLLLATVLVGGLLDRPRIATLAGSAAALALFTANLALATDLVVPGLHLLALQLQTMVAVALTGVVVYRLVSQVSSSRVGLAAGVAVALASPLGFWATYPKRHALVTLFVVSIMYWLARNRATGRVRYRAMAYGAVGLVTWIHAAEGVVVLLALALVDLPTAPRRDLRTLAVIALALGGSLVPAVVTNLLISGQPLRPPRLLTVDTVNPLVGALTPLWISVPLDGIPALVPTLDPLWRLVDHLLEGIHLVLTDPERLYHIFVRSGYIEQTAAGDGGEAITLSLLESMPLAAALIGTLSHLRRSLRSDRDGRHISRVRTHLATPAGTVDLFSLIFTLLFVILYVPRLPLPATITVRYLVPIVPALLYIGSRLPAVQCAIDWEPNTLVSTYLVTALIGGQLLLLYILVSELTLGEAVQLHALVALGTAAMLGVWTIASDIKGFELSRPGAVTLGGAAAVTTVFLLLSGLVHFSYSGEFVLPLAGWLNELFTP